MYSINEGVCVCVSYDENALGTDKNDDITNPSSDDTNKIYLFVVKTI